MMSNFGILMFIFGVSVLLVGLYMYSGHELGIMTNRPAFKNLDIDAWKNIGKWTLFSGVIILIISIIAFIFKL